MRNAIYAMCHKLFGAQPVGYYTLALLTHLLNVALLFLIITRTTRSVWIAAAGAGLWGASPLHLGTVGYYSVYGQILATTAISWVLLRMTRLTTTTNISSLELASWAIALLVSSMSFGVGIGAVLVFPAAVIIAFGPGRESRRKFVGFCLLAALVVSIYLASHWLFGVLTEKPAFARETVDTLLLMLPSFQAGLKMLGELFAIGATGSLVGVFAPFATLSVTTAATFATGLLVLAVVGSTRLSSRHRKQVWIWILLSASSYGLIALSRALVIETQEPTSYAGPTAWRYHYAGSLPLVAAMCLTFSSFASWSVIRRVRGDWAACSVLVAALLAIVVNQPQPEDRQFWRSHVRTVFDAVEAAALSVPPGHTAYIYNRTWSAIPYSGFPGWAGLFIALTDSNQLHGREIRFVERISPNRRRQMHLHENTRLAKLLISRNAYHEVNAACLHQPKIPMSTHPVSNTPTPLSMLHPECQSP